MHSNNTSPSNIMGGLSVSLVPRPVKIEREKKGLVSTVHACANYVDVNIIIKL